MSLKVAIIGANGFVGRHVVERVRLDGGEATGIVRSEAAAQLVDSLGGRSVRVPDLGAATIATLVPAFHGCAGIVYTASVSTGQPEDARTSPQGLANVIEAAKSAGVPRVVFFSGLGIAHYGINPHCTNSYFLAKMAGEVALFRSGIGATVLRPSYIFGAGDEFLSPLLRRASASSEIEIPGDGRYRLQPVSVHDAARAALGACLNVRPVNEVVDLVGPERVSYRHLLDRIAVRVGKRLEIQERPIDEAIAAARAGGYFGLRPHDLACLLCDEVGDSEPVETLVGRPLVSLEDMLAETLATLSNPASTSR